jgi:predicted alpha/beta hydrolase family esterase
MKKTVIIVHGAYGYPEENWFGWLKRQLEAEEIVCHVPALPTPQGQDLQAWSSVFEQAVGDSINDQTILIGHSLGAAFILRWLEQKPRKVFAVILTGAFIGSVGDQRFDLINQSFFQTDFDWEVIRGCSRSFTCYYGTEDNYVTRQQFHFIARQLNARKIIISKAGHFNCASGYGRFPHLLLQLQTHVYS